MSFISPPPPPKPVRITNVHYGELLPSGCYFCVTVMLLCADGTLRESFRSNVHKTEVDEWLDSLILPEKEAA